MILLFYLLKLQPFLLNARKTTSLDVILWVRRRWGIWNHLQPYQAHCWQSVVCSFEICRGTTLQLFCFTESLPGSCCSHSREKDPSGFLSEAFYLLYQRHRSELSLAKHSYATGFPSSLNDGPNIKIDFYLLIWKDRQKISIVDKSMKQHLWRRGDRQGHSEIVKNASITLACRFHWKIWFKIWKPKSIWFLPALFSLKEYLTGGDQAKRKESLH